MSPNTPGEVLIPGAIAIVFVVAWFVFGVIDATRDDRTRPSHRHDLPDAGQGQPGPSPLNQARGRHPAHRPTDHTHARINE